MSKGDYRAHHDDRLKNDWVNRVKRYWPQIFNLLASFSAIIILIITVFGVEKKTTKELIFIIELSVFSISLFSFVIIQEFRYSRKARYSEAMYSVHSCIHFLRDFHCDFNSICKEIDCKHALSQVITSFANAFSLVTGTHCRACIKTIEIRNKTQEQFQSINDPKERVKYLYVTTFCRDSASALGKSADDEYTHPINGNTDFLELYLDVNKRMFISNDLNSEKGYQNSSLQANKELPYRSTIVWPIRKLVYKQDIEMKKGIFNQEQDIIGYLCIDSASRNVFLKRYDFEMGAIVADALFIFLKNYHAYLNK
jgi:hypothetical protein